MLRTARHFALPAGIAATLSLLFCAHAAAPRSIVEELADLEFAPSLPPSAPIEIAPLAKPLERAQPRRIPARASREMQALSDTITKEQRDEGTFSPGLRHYLLELASLYRQVDDHIAALATLERTRQIVRVNNGLSSLDQAEVIALEIESLEALGQRTAAAERRETLLDLARENPTDLRVGPIYASVADARVKAVEDWLADPSEPAVIFGPGPSGDNSAGGSGYDIVRRGLMSAQFNYVAALRATATNGTAGGPDIYEIENALMHTFYIQAQKPGIFFGSETTLYRVRKMLDEVGTSSYERRVKYSEVLTRPPAQIARLLIELGDWHLLFHADAAGLAAYGRARDVLVAAGASSDQLDELFTPSNPILVPVFAPHLISASDAQDYDGWFDVELELNDRGRSERVEIVAQSLADKPNLTTSALKARLEKHIAKTQFRPRFASGERVATPRVALRYYFRY